MSDPMPVTNATMDVFENSDYFLAHAAQMGRKDTGPYIVFPILFVAMVAVIFFMARSKRWADYAYDGKWASRLSLFALMLIAIIASLGTNAWMLGQVKGKISPEFPSLTSDAIKIGLYGLEFRQQVASWVPADQKDLYDCVAALGFADHGKRPRCATPDCVRPYPASSKEEILNSIRDVQTGKIPATDQLQVCKRVTLR